MLGRAFSAARCRRKSVASAKSVEAGEFVAAGNQLRRRARRIAGHFDDGILPSQFSQFLLLRRENLLIISRRVPPASFEPVEPDLTSLAIYQLAILAARLQLDELVFHRDLLCLISFGAGLDQLGAYHIGQRDLARQTTLEVSIQRCYRHAEQERSGHHIVDSPLLFE